MNTATWILLPCIAAAIGWFTNFIAVRMIFRPHRRINILGFGIQGLLPKRKAEFARSIGETVEEHLVSAEDIKALLDDPEVAESLRRAVSERLDDFLENKLVGGNPMLGAFLKGPLVDKIKSGVSRELGNALGSIVDTLGDHLDEQLDMKSIVSEKIEGFDMHQLEAIVLKVAKKELVAIEILGALLGFVVGLVQLLVLSLLS